MCDCLEKVNDELKKNGSNTMVEVPILFNFKMGTEYFVVLNSFAAPFISETSYVYIEGESPAQALLEYCEKHHPYSAQAYWTADDFHKGNKPAARYLCNYELAKQKAAQGLNSFRFVGISERSFSLNDVEYIVDNPRGGEII